MSSGLLSALAAEMVTHQFAWIATPEESILELSPALDRQFGGKLPVDPAVLQKLTEETVRDGAAAITTSIGGGIWRLCQVSLEYQDHPLIAGWGVLVA
jgi:hypothetical protein